MMNCDVMQLTKIMRAPLFPENMDKSHNLKALLLELYSNCVRICDLAQ